LQAVVLAAGRGTRLHPLTERLPKGLLKVAGREMLFRNMALLSKLGVEEFVVVTNPDYSERIRSFLEVSGFRYKLLVNESPERGQGSSLYTAKGAVGEKFLLFMSDHLYSPEFLEEAAGAEGIVVDEAGAYINPEEATKVLCEGGRVKDIGKDLEEYHGYDTGFFVLDREIFKLVGSLLSEKGSVEMSEIVRAASLKCTYVTGHFWIDVDTPDDVARARRQIVRSSVKGVGDGYISKKINRRVSLALSEYLVERLTPNQATVLSFLLGMISAALALFQPWAGGLLYQLSSMLDGIDGEIARASMRITKFGGWLDSVLDRYVDFAFILALALWLRPEPAFWAVVALALFGSTMISYSTERYRGAYFEDVYAVIPSMKYLLGKRDERIFLIMIFCLLGWIRELIILLAVFTNLRVMITVFLVWKHKRAE